jgi:hypothetical protein
LSKLSVSQYHKDGKLNIDGVDVSIHVRRMNMDEFIQFEREYFDYAQGDRSRGSAVSIDTNGLSPEDAFFAVQKAEAEYELRKTPAEKEADRQATIDRANQLLQWLKAKIEENAVFPPGEVDIDGEPVLTGADIHRVFGARQVLMMQIANVIWAQNRLPAGILKNLQSPSDFPAGSEGREKEAVGPRPEPTAGSAGSGDSAATADATPAPNSGTSPSGETTE